MRYSYVIGIVSSVCVMIVCFMPWVYIGAIHTTITGFHAEHTNFGRPGLMHLIFSVVAVLLFALKKIGPKRVNIFICALNFAWSLRNFILITRCESGECPEKRMGIYLLILFAFIMLLMSLLPETKEQPATDN